MSPAFFAQPARVQSRLRVRVFHGFIDRCFLKWWPETLPNIRLKFIIRALDSRKMGIICRILRVRSQAFGKSCPKSCPQYSRDDRLVAGGLTRRDLNPGHWGVYWYLSFQSCRTVESNWTIGSPESSNERRVCWAAKCITKDCYEGAVHSMRKARTGSMEAARRAGMMPAMAAVSTSTPMAMVITDAFTLVVS